MIHYGRHHLDEDDIQAVVDVLRSGWLTQGPIVEAFEDAIANYVGSKYAVAVSNCSTGLHIAAIAAGLGPNKSLVTSPITFVSSPNSALYVGATPVFVDIDPGTINMSISSLCDVLEKDSSIRVVTPVHFAGLPCDMEKIKDVVDKYDVVIIEDAAHALGAHYADGSKVGCCSKSLMTVFSFHPVKSIAAGEGGVITTNDEVIYRKLLRLRSHGINKMDDSYQLPEQAKTNGIDNPWYYEMQELGFNYRITDIQCGLALSQLKKIDKFISRRREIVGKYDKAFTDIPHCHPIQLNYRELSSHHLYVLQIDYAAIGMTRAQFILELRKKDIGTQVHYIPVPAQPYYQKLGFNPDDYRNAMHYYEQALTIPLYYDLSDEQVSSIINVFKKLLS